MTACHRHLHCSPPPTPNTTSCTCLFPSPLRNPPIRNVRCCNHRLGRCERCGITGLKRGLTTMCLIARRLSCPLCTPRGSKDRTSPSRSAKCDALRACRHTCHRPLAAAWLTSKMRIRNCVRLYDCACVCAAAAACTDNRTLFSRHWALGRVCWPRSHDAAGSWCNTHSHSLLHSLLTHTHTHTHKHKHTHTLRGLNVQARMSGKVDPVGVLCHMRRARGGCVQKPSQWRWLVTAARDYLLAVHIASNRQQDTATVSKH